MKNPSKSLESQKKKKKVEGDGGGRGGVITKDQNKHTPLGRVLSSVLLCAT